ncbi:MAG TPA: acyl-CoA desaturase [Labilithrix sp.]|jgi:stearoyl-CoA desaturase (delta-9 desaturase)
MQARLLSRRPPIDVASAALLVLMHLAVLLVLVVPFHWSLVALALGGYALRMLAITVGFHRYFSHRAFKTSRGFQLVLALLGTCAMQNGPLWWASWHRRHHKHADGPLDPHSPAQRGFWQSHLGWVLAAEEREQRDLSNVSDLSRFPELRFLDAHKWLPLVGWGVACFAIAGWSGVVWGFVVSTVAVDHATFLINSVSHLWGTRRYDTPDDSRNNALLAALTFGEGWHNNHHSYMSCARQGFARWEIDPSYWAIRLLALLGIVWDVREPPASVMAVARSPVDELPTR